MPKYEVFQIVLRPRGESWFVWDPGTSMSLSLPYTSLDFSCGLELGRDGSEQL